MKNPLIKRLPRELKNELGKYLVLFVFITGIIAIVSGFLVASGSMKTTYNKSFEKYNVEDGNFELVFQADSSLIETLEKEAVTIYENFYLEKETDDIDSTLRIFKIRENVNKICLMEGRLPETATEIAIDRMYADNNSLSVGDSLSIGGKNLIVSGLVALTDYSALFSSTYDMMFDAVKFGVAVMTSEGFESFGENNLHYSYSWKYDTAPIDDTHEKEMSEDFLKVLSDNAMVSNYVPQYLNPAIQFTGNDIGRDSQMFTIFLYIVITIIAFIFAITTSNTISKEANVIGTLRASGYSKSELIRHYLAMPIGVTLFSALTGNLLGYTYFRIFAADLYYASYSLTTYVTLWNADAFVKTTVIPAILMFIINFVILFDKLRLSPLKFLRRDLKKGQKKKVFRLTTKTGIMKRFRLRIIFQNMPNYITIVIGIFLANLILLLGLAFPALLDKYQQDITSNMLCEYQYILKTPIEINDDAAEKYSVATLQTPEGKLKSEQVTLFGIQPDSSYVTANLNGDSIYISNAFSEKFNISIGDTITLEAEYEETEYTFAVQGIHYYPAGIAVFMNQDYFNEIFEKESDYFNGYLSNKELEEIDERYIATKITEDDLTKTSRQMKLSMGGVMDMFFWFGLIMFMLIIYLLSKLIIEKNAQSISMTKILGYTNSEISGLYIMSTSLVVIGSFFLTMPLANEIMRYVCVAMLSEYSGWLPYYVPASAYAKILASGIIAYALIVWKQFAKVKKIPLDMALKNVE